MFGVDTSELILIAVAALIFIGPKDLPHAMRTAGRWIGKVRGMARHFNAGVEAMVREAELEELERHWREENERIMREFPAVAADQSAEAKAYLGTSAPGRLADPAETRAELEGRAAGESVPPEQLPPEQRELP